MTPDASGEDPGLLSEGSRQQNLRLRSNFNIVTTTLCCRVLKNKKVDHDPKASITLSKIKGLLQPEHRGALIKFTPLSKFAIPALGIPPHASVTAGFHTKHYRWVLLNRKRDNPNSSEFKVLWKSHVVLPCVNLPSQLEIFLN